MADLKTLLATLRSRLEPPTAAEAQAHADAARDRRDWATAARHYRRSLDLDPTRAAIWVQYGHALKESGRRAEAETAYRQAVTLAPDDADAALQLGHALMLLDRSAAALAAFERALILMPTLRPAREALRDLARRGLRSTDPAVMEALRSTQPRFRPQSTSGGTGAPAHEARYIFDVSDLLGYFRNARLPTGIQRVQIEVISALLSTPDRADQIAVCAFAEGRDGWVPVPSDLFLDLADAARADGALDDPDWQRLMDTLQTELELAPPLRFRTGAWLVNLGTSWWLQNYFLRVREARRRYGIRYVPFVHDMIPVMAPEHCVRPLTQDFISWVMGVFTHADGWLTNSRASARDLDRVADRLGHRVDPEQVHVVPLDADFRPPAELALDPALRERHDAEVLARFGLAADRYVLFVSTIESRKNHLEAFRAWQSLIDRHGEDAVPTLVCVGNHGWLNDAVFARLDSDPTLQRKVQMRRGLADADLASLYRQAAFTLYPSLYEGWGLPVTESLCHGTPVLASDSSSLPEAGGDLAVYYRAGDTEGLVETLERLSLTDSWRQRLRADIAHRFRPRSWAEVAEDMLARLAAWDAESPGALPDAPVPRLPLGRYVWMRRSLELAVRPCLLPAEAFRAGDTWRPPEDWGCPTRAGEALLKMRLEGASGPLRLFIGLRAPDGPACNWQLESGGTRIDGGRLQTGSVAWRAVDLPAPGEPGAPLILALQSRLVADGTARPDSPPPGVGMIGFMICAADDTQRRADFLEALRLDDLAGLERRQIAGAEQDCTSPSS